MNLVETLGDGIYSVCLTLCSLPCLMGLHDYPKTSCYCPRDSEILISCNEALDEQICQWCGHYDA